MSLMSIMNQLDEISKAAIQEDLANHKPIYTPSAQGKSLITLLESAILRWPTRDYRMSPIYRNKFGLQYGSENHFLVKIFQGMDLKVSKRLPLQSMTEFSILMPSNLSGIESYNQEVNKHNDEWQKNGSLNFLFDAAHLDIYPVNGAVESISYKSRHIKSLDFSQYYKGKLSTPDPEQSRRVVGTILAKIEILGEEFQVGYCVKNIQGELLYCNTIRENDLALIGRKLIHECFGNPFQTSQTYVENLLEGVPQLLQGKKIQIALHDNHQPDWVTGSYKIVKKEFISDDVKTVIMTSSGDGFTYIGAFISAIISIPFLFSGFMGMIKGKDSSSLEIGIIIAVGGTALSWYISKKIYQQAETQSQNKYLKF